METSWRTHSACSLTADVHISPSSECTRSACPDCVQVRRDQAIQDLCWAEERQTQSTLLYCATADGTTESQPPRPLLPSNIAPCEGTIIVYNVDVDQRYSMEEAWVGEVATHTMAMHLRRSLEPANMIDMLFTPLCRIARTS